MFSTLKEKVRRGYKAAGQYIGALKLTPSRTQTQAMLFVLGVSLLTVGLMASAGAQVPEGAQFNDDRIANAVNTLFTYLEGSFGALVMVASGIGAILSSAFGQYRAALGCLIVAVGAFILRSIMSAFFNTSTIDQG